MQVSGVSGLGGLNRRRRREERGPLSSVKGGLLGGGAAGTTPSGPVAGLVGGLLGGAGGLLGGVGSLVGDVGNGLMTVLDEGWGGDVVRGRNGINDDVSLFLSFPFPLRSSCWLD